MRDLRVLVADDDRPCRDALVEFLRREGFLVSVARDGAEALAEFLRQPVDCSIMDVNMPGLNGPDVLRHLLLEATPQRVPPTVFVSSDSSASALIKENLAQLVSSPVGFLPKPVRIQTLRQTLQHLLSLGSDPWDGSPTNWPPRQP